MDIKDHAERKQNSEDGLVSWEGRQWHFIYLFLGFVRTREQGFSRNGLRTTWDACGNAESWATLGPAESQSLGPGICLLAPMYAVNQSCKEAADVFDQLAALISLFATGFLAWYLTSTAELGALEFMNKDSHPSPSAGSSLLSL